MRNYNGIKKPSYFFYSLASLLLILSACSISGKYYSKYDSKKYDSKRYGTRMFNSIELEKDCSYTIHEWYFVHHDLRHIINVKSGDWIAQGDTVIIDGKKYLHNSRNLTDIEGGVKWRKRLLIFAKKE